jgi:hypothetical protein
MTMLRRAGADPAMNSSLPYEGPKWGPSRATAFPDPPFVTIAGLTWVDPEPPGRRAAPVDPVFEFGI